MSKVLWNLYAHGYDAIAGLAPYRDMLDEVVDSLDLAPGMRVLDAGCGTGALAERAAIACPDVEWVGVDLSATMLKRARRRQRWPDGFRFVEANLDDFLDQGQVGFDRIASVNVIWTLPDPAATLSRMAKALRPTGRMVHTTPRLRFNFQRIVWAHLARQRGWARVRAALGLPLLALVGLLNLVLVAQSMLSRARHRRERWDARGLEELLRKAGSSVRTVRPCYVGQGHLLVCEQDTGPSPLPPPAKGL